MKSFFERVNNCPKMLGYNPIAIEVPYSNIAQTVKDTLFPYKRQELEQ
jgi:hypothetical protein